MSDKPPLAILDGDDWRQAIAAEESAQEAGTLFDLPQLEQRLEQGAVVKIFDRTNCVFYLGLFQAAVGADLKGLEPLAAVGRAMFVLAGLADLEQKLADSFQERAGVVMTGAPSELDGLEHFLSNQSATAWLSKQEGRFLISLTGVDYEQLMEQRMSGSHDPGQPEPQLDEVFAAPTLRGAYIAAARHGELTRDRRYRERGQVAPPLRSPVLLPEVDGLGPRSRPSGLAERELG